MSVIDCCLCCNDVNTCNSTDKFNHGLDQHVTWPRQQRSTFHQFLWSNPLKWLSLNGLTKVYAADI